MEKSKEILQWRTGEGRKLGEISTKQKKINDDKWKKMLDKENAKESEPWRT